MKLLRLIANLGYGSRKEVAWMFREGRITDANGQVLYADDQVEHAHVRVDGEPLGPNKPAIIAYHHDYGHSKASLSINGRLLGASRVFAISSLRSRIWAP